MADLYLEWRTDLSLSPAGDLALADGPDLTRQRILRRLLTPVATYIWHLEYGAGIPQKIGHAGRSSVIEGLVRANIALEASVATYPPPTVSVTEDSVNPGLFVIAINYTDAELGIQTALTFDTTGLIVSPILRAG